MKFRVRIWRETMANARKREKGRGTEQVGGWDPVLSVEERRRGWKRREQTGPMCVCSAENNVHTEALMRFKNNGDYLHYSLGITRTAGDALAFAPRLASPRVASLCRATAPTNPVRPAIPRFLVLRLLHARARDTQTRILHTPRREFSDVELLAAKQCRGRKLIIPLLQSNSLPSSYDPLRILRLPLCLAGDSLSLSLSLPLRFAIF